MDEDEFDIKTNDLVNEFDDEEDKTLVIKLSTYEKIRQSKIKRKKASKKNIEIQSGLIAIA